MGQDPFAVLRLVEIDVLGIKFLLDYGHFFAVVMPASEARSIVQRFHAGQFPDDTVIGDMDGQQTWSLRASAIKAVHTFAPEQSQLTPQTGYGRIPPGASGIN